jgi:rhodanese-related sulfurtransferase
MSLEQLAFYQQKLAYETDSWDLYVALRDEGHQVVVVDGRSPEAYAKEHIPGAINIPHRTISQDSLTSLDKTRLYVTYCDGIGCNASTKTAMKMLTLGFRVKELLGGMDWWKRDGYATAGEEARSGAMVTCGCDGSDICRIDS